MTINPKSMEKFVIQPSSYSYTTIGTAYNSPRREIEYSAALTKTGKNYYDSKIVVPANERMSTAAEELAIQLSLERAGKDPRKAEAFNDLYGRNTLDWCAWQWTDTGLRVPEGRDPGKYETIDGRKYWARIVLIGDKEVGEILVPEGRGRVISKWNEVFGLPAETEDVNFAHSPYTTFFWFNDFNPRKDSISGHYDVAVMRRAFWPHGGRDDECIDVDAVYGRWAERSNAGFRAVHGYLPYIEKSITKNSN
ncbi:MAG: hypothetical protein V1836_03370 [Candidatus Aenigmatarchaeota archaeon]